MKTNKNLEKYVQEAYMYVGSKKDGQTVVELDNGIKIEVKDVGVLGHQNSQFYILEITKDEKLLDKFWCKIAPNDNAEAIEEIGLNYLSYLWIEREFKDKIKKYSPISFTKGGTRPENYIITRDCGLNLEKIIDATKDAELYASIINFQFGDKEAVDNLSLPLEKGRKSKLKIKAFTLNDSWIEHKDDDAAKHSLQYLLEKDRRRADRLLINKHLLAPSDGAEVENIKKRSEQYLNSVDKFCYPGEEIGLINPEMYQPKNFMIKKIMNDKQERYEVKFIDLICDLKGGIDEYSMLGGYANHVIYMERFYGMLKKDEAGYKVADMVYQRQRELAIKKYGEEKADELSCIGKDHWTLQRLWGQYKNEIHATEEALKPMEIKKDIAVKIIDNIKNDQDIKSKGTEINNST